MPETKKSLSEFIADAIGNDFLITIAITSYTKAKYHTRNLPFGLGKTTLAMELAYLLNGGSVKDYHMRTVWTKVHDIMAYNPYTLGELLSPGRPRLPCAIWDDVQATAPAAQTVPSAIRKLANFISTQRPECACIFFTTPNISFISAPLRKLINFEIIISERGFYEVHKISYYKDFNRPLQDRMHFDYVDEIPAAEPFPPLPQEEQAWYNQWRTDHKKQLYPSMMKDLKVYTQLRQWENQDTELVEIQSKITKVGGNNYGAIVPYEVAKDAHGEPVDIIFRRKRVE